MHGLLDNYGYGLSENGSYHFILQNCPFDGKVMIKHQIKSCFTKMFNIFSHKPSVPSRSIHIGHWPRLQSDIRSPQVTTLRDNQSLGAGNKVGKTNRQPSTINKNLAKNQWSQDDAPGIPGIYDWNSPCEWCGLDVQNTHLLRAPWAKHCWPSIGSWPPPISGWENR